MWNQIAHLEASDGTYRNQFGKDVVITRDFILVSAYQAQPSGAVYIYDLNDNWSETKLIPPRSSSDEDENSMFGYSVAATDTTIVVASPGVNQYHGAVYVYTKTTNPPNNNNHQNDWNLDATLFADHAIDKDYFGISVAISEDASTIFVGSGIVYTTQRGRQFVYQFEKRNTGGWTLAQRISPPSSLDPVTMYAPYFGRVMAYHNQQLMVGSPGHARHGTTTTSRGIVHVFEKQQQNDDATTKPGGLGTILGQQQQQNQRDIARPWINLLLSILVLYILPKLFLWNGQYRRTGY